MDQDLQRHFAMVAGAVVSMVQSQVLRDNTDTNKTEDDKLADMKATLSKIVSLRMADILDAVCPRLNMEAPKTSRKCGPLVWTLGVDLCGVKCGAQWALSST